MAAFKRGGKQIGNIFSCQTKSRKLVMRNENQAMQASPRILAFKWRPWSFLIWSNGACGVIRFLDLGPDCSAINRDALKSNWRLKLTSLPNSSSYITVSTMTQAGAATLQPEWENAFSPVFCHTSFWIWVNKEPRKFREQLNCFIDTDGSSSVNTSGDRYVTICSLVTSPVSINAANLLVGSKQGSL